MSKSKKKYHPTSAAEKHKAAQDLGTHGGRAKRRWRWEKKPIGSKTQKAPRRSRRSRRRSRKR